MSRGRREACHMCDGKRLIFSAALLLETKCSLHSRRESDEYAKVKASITPVLQAVREHVLEFEQLIQ